MPNISEIIEAIEQIKGVHLSPPYQHQGRTCYDILGGITGDSFIFGNIHEPIGITLNHSIRSETPELARQYNTLRHELAKRKIKFEEFFDDE